MPKERVFLVGFMGAGKSTVGPLLADKLGWEFIDLDQRIEKIYRQSVPEIFQQQGEAYFRCLETQAIQELKSQIGCVVALGGGAFVQEANRNLICDFGHSVFLDCPFETIWSRCPVDGTRPLFKNRAQIRELYKTRLPYYLTADFRVDVSNLTPETIVDLIAQWLVNLNQEGRPR